MCITFIMPNYVTQYVYDDEPTTLFTSPGFTLYRILQLVLYNLYHTITYITTVIYATD